MRGGAEHRYVAILSGGCAEAGDAHVTTMETPEVGGADPSALRIAHEVAVDPRSGRASVAVPLRAAGGRGGVAPRLALHSHSSRERGVFCTGRPLSGLPRLSSSTRLRCPANDRQGPL